MQHGLVAVPHIFKGTDFIRYFFVIKTFLDQMSVYMRLFKKILHKIYI